MNFNDWKNLLLKMPGAKQAKVYLARQGHSESEADIGGLAVALLSLLILIILFNSFLFGIIIAFSETLWSYCRQNTVEATGIGIFGTVMFLAILFKMLHKKEEKLKEQDMEKRRKRHKLDEKRQYIKKGAMGNFEEVFRFLLSEKCSDIEIKSVHTIDLTPRIRFAARKFIAEDDSDVNKNFQLFREALFKDSLSVIEMCFQVSENIPSVIVDAMMSFIDRKAKYYDGTVLSVKAKRETFKGIDLEKTTPFKILASFDLRYNDGMEVQPLPEDVSKQARVLEKLKEKAPKLNVFYETKRTAISDGWEKPKDLDDVPAKAIDTLREKNMSEMPLAEFQDLAVGLLGKLGFDVRKVKKIPGGTLQIQADFPHPVIGGNFMVLARQYPETAPVHLDLVRELDELTREESCKRGIYLVTGLFTEEARNTSKKLAVDLVDGRRIAELLDGPPYEDRWSIRVVDETGKVMDLSRMSLLDFQQEVDQFLKSMGFRVVKIRRDPGGSVVAVAEHPHPVTGGKFAVLARQFPADTRVEAEVVSEFALIMKTEFCQRGILMVPAEFARDSQALARFSGVELVDRNTWENLRRHREING